MHVTSLRTTQPANRASANNTSSAGISRPAATVNKPVVQLTKSLTYAVSPEAVVSASAKSRWMMVQGLQQLGYPDWHLTIFPINQEKWSHSFQLPANGNPPVQKWMLYNEFHFTNREGDHFFYTDDCVPLKSSMESRGKSPAWELQDKWTWANWICHQYFNVNYNALQQYVQERPKAEQEEAKKKKAEEQFQQNLWELYKDSVRRFPEWHEKEKLDVYSWTKLIQDGYRGTDEQFKLQIAEEVKGIPYPTQERVWVDNEKGYGYETPQHEKSPNSSGLI
ncbi:hypothetical protein [[Flexibacter] sp. ATCC 35208]|uniref:hypothetical protein n=1 Tax=[Flexibacter] sp. ATCC 35208 TaxID=1936242 RepID=UPI0009C60DA8|nr:hypothetical protein [[Flexibacter] sp. ATCC 35208]OMP77553.1 hypothetical protein BW716_19340 [[Flexibacter] sp. ATCC 35208]